MDLASAKENLVKFKEKVNVEVFEISAAFNKGLKEVIDALANKLKEMPNNPLYDDSQIESHILYKFEKTKPFTITKDEDGWVIQGSEIERIFKMTKFTTDEAIYRFARKLRRMGIDDELEKLGAKEGDSVRILDFYFEYKN